MCFSVIPPYRLFRFFDFTLFAAPLVLAFSLICAACAASPASALESRRGALTFPSRKSNLSRVPAGRNVDQVTIARRGVEL